MKEPKLFAEIRKARERAETAMPQMSPPPGLPPMTASVQDPPNGLIAVPTNYLAETLRECTTVEHCETLLAHAKQHGYDENGQVVRMIREKGRLLKDGKPHASLHNEHVHVALFGQKSHAATPQLLALTGHAATEPVETKATTKRGGRR